MSCVLSGFRMGRRLAMLGTVLLLAACAGGPEKPQPATLSANAALIGVRLAWSARIGAVHFPLDVAVSVTTVTLACSDGSRKSKPFPPALYLLPRQHNTAG